MTENPPIDVVDLLRELNNKLLELLRSLDADEWQIQTVAKEWKVKDVVAHLLDGNIRVLSMLRDNYFGEKTNTGTYQELVDFLNRLNAEWVTAMKRVSPQMLVFLHEVTGGPFCDYFKSIDPFGKAAFPVDWAGESESKNWMEIAREYSEKWLHQQQIRDAVGKPGLMTRELFFPFIDILMRALPHTYRGVTAENGTSIKVTISSEIGGSWCLVRAEDSWTLYANHVPAPTAEIILDPATSWKLFSKSLRPQDVKDNVTIGGNKTLAETALSMVSVMA